VSRADAIAALDPRNAAGFVSGMAWLPPELLGLVSAHSGSATQSQALAAVASSIPVNLAFVSAGSGEASDSVATLHVADVAVVWTVDGVFSRVAEAVGWVEALGMTAAEPGSLTIRLDEALHDALMDVRAASEFGADAVLIADDLAGPAGPLLSPDYALDALVPCYHRLALEVAAGGLPALFHSDGDVRTLLPALARAGYSAVHLAGLGSDAFAASAAAARRAGLLVLGGIPAAALPDGARDAGERAGEVAASLGGTIVCDDGGITTFEQLTALKTGIDAARDAYLRPRA
jgi:hypothetical protein